MVRIDTEIFFKLWSNRERQLGRRLTMKEASEVSGLAPLTIRSIRDGNATRLDLSSLSNICQLLNIPSGPVPFLVIDGNGTTDR